MVEHITLRNQVTGNVLELDKVTTPNYILESVSWGEVKGTHHSYKYVNQIGVHITNTSLETRDVEVVGWIVADSDAQMTNFKSKLNRFANPQQNIEVTYSDYKISFSPDSSVKYSATVAENNEVMCKFKIEGLASDPLFKDSVDTKVLAASTKPLFHFPLIINKDDQSPPTIMFGAREPSLIVGVFNYGSVSTGMRIVFRAVGTLSGPSLVNVLTQEYFKLDTTLHAGDEVEIITTIGEKRVTGHINGVNKNYFKYRDLGSAWLQLEVGDNMFRYDADSGIDNLEVYIYFSNKYLEVQECY